MVLERLRPSLGTAIVMGLREGALPDPPTTAYLMVGEGCSGNCAFCTQARDSECGSDLLSRVTWPEFPADDVIEAFGKGSGADLKRICLQCLNDTRTLSVLPELIEKLFAASGLPVSVSIPLMDDEYLRALKDSGADRVGIALDAAEKNLFDEVKGRLAGNNVTWEEVWGCLRTAVHIFGEGKVSTHIIVGLGETDREIVEVMMGCREMGVSVSLFAYTPMRGVRHKGKPPDLSRYRALQAARGAVVEGSLADGFGFDVSGRLSALPERVFAGALDPSRLFMTRGCPDCNRPYYNERPRGPIFNYPRPLTIEEQKRAFSQVRSYLEGAE